MRMFRRLKKQELRTLVRVSLQLFSFAVSLMLNISLFSFLAAGVAVMICCWSDGCQLIGREMIHITDMLHH